MPEPERVEEESGMDTNRSGKAMIESFRNMDLAERYEHAVDRIVARGQTQVILYTWIHMLVVEHGFTCCVVEDSPNNKPVMLHRKCYYVW